LSVLDSIPNPVPPPPPTPKETESKNKHKRKRENKSNKRKSTLHGTLVKLFREFLIHACGPKDLSKHMKNTMYGKRVTDVINRNLQMGYCTTTEGRVDIRREILDDQGWPRTNRQWEIRHPKAHTEGASEQCFGCKKWKRISTIFTATSLDHKTTESSVIRWSMGGHCAERLISVLRLLKSIQEAFVWCQSSSLIKNKKKDRHLSSEETSDLENHFRNVNQEMNLIETPFMFGGKNEMNDDPGEEIESEGEESQEEVPNDEDRDFIATSEDDDDDDDGQHFRKRHSKKRSRRDFFSPL
jgi:hypothetical protein